MTKCCVKRCIGPRGLRGHTGPTGTVGPLTFLSLNNPTTETIGSSTGTILWDVVVEDDDNMYNPLLRTATIPSDGLWQIHARVTVDQDGMTGFPSDNYQHLLVISKTIPFPDGFNIRFIDAFQQRTTVAEPTKQVVLQGTETIRLILSDVVQIQVFTVLLDTTTPVDTDISGTVCLNCCTFTRIGD